MITTSSGETFGLLACGTPDAIRTHDLQSRSLTLYPAELRARMQFIYTLQLSLMSYGRVCNYLLNPIAQVDELRARIYFLFIM